MVNFGDEPIAIQRLAAHRFQYLVIEFHDRAAVVANEVMVAVLFEDLVLANATAEVSLRDHAKITEKLERAVHRRAVDHRGSRPNPSEDFVGCEVLIPIFEYRKNHQALWSRALTDGAKSFGKLGVARINSLVY